MLPELVTLSAAMAGIGELLDRYGRTSYGANPFTLEGFVNVLSVAQHIERARAEVLGVFGSVWRSLEVNAKVPGSSKTSRHMQGLAADIVAGAGFTGESAARRIVQLARRGELGSRVRDVIWEQRRDGAGRLVEWTHVDFFAAAETTRPLRIQRKPAEGGFELWTPT